MKWAGLAVGVGLSLLLLITLLRGPGSSSEPVQVQLDAVESPPARGSEEIAASLRGENAPPPTPENVARIGSELAAAHEREFEEQVTREAKRRIAPVLDRVAASGTVWPDSKVQDFLNVTKDIVRREMEGLRLVFRVGRSKGYGEAEIREAMREASEGAIGLTEAGAESFLVQARARLEAAARSAEQLQRMK